MKAVITVIGKDRVGILARVATECSKVDANILDVTQSVLQDVFTMVMLADIGKMTVGISQLSDIMNELGREIGLSISVMHEDIFNSMHRI